MNHKARQFWYGNYWWLAPVLAGLLIITLFLAQIDKKWEIGATVLGVLLGVFYFVQKQKLEEIELFEKLFTKFNERYGCLHDQLQVIICEGSTLTVQQRNTLDAYFNLCAEEHLFHEQGRILPCVWQSWCRGMLSYIACPRIGKFWQEQQGAGNHYGLTTQEIEKGANRSLSEATCPKE